MSSKLHSPGKKKGGGTDPTLKNHNHILFKGEGGTAKTNKNDNNNKRGHSSFRRKKRHDE